MQSINVNQISPRDKAVLMGLFLSRFNQKALEAFGFMAFRQAYNAMGLSIGVVPKSIQNYRDEFDPYFPNKRMGWRNRKLRDFCKDYMDLTQNLDFNGFCELINAMLLGKEAIIDSSDIVIERRKENRKYTAQRLITGRAAEEYFVSNYQSISMFNGYDLMDTTQMGCGFDFKLFNEESRYYVEVKGVNEKRGNVLMTEKEFETANDLRDLYCLFVVSNFRETPEHQLFFNPLNCGDLNIQRQERVIQQVSYTVNFI